MLSHEQAEARLRAFRVHNRPRQIDRVRELPGVWRGIGLAWLDLDESGKPFSNETIESTARAAATRQTANATDAERRALFDALFGQLGPYVEAGWQIHVRLPYQLDWQRKAFRMPHTPEATRPARQAWLDRLIATTSEYDQPLAWFAHWAPYLGYQADALGVLFAAAIDTADPSGQEVIDILLASANGEDEIGMMGRHVTRALLVASRPDGWDFVERLLLAAQRQEGLRQVILETIDEAHPEAFRRMLRVIEEHDLTRFSATIRAMDVWFGFGWDSANVREANAVLAQVRRYLCDPAERASAVASGEPQTAYLALWSAAFDDAASALPQAVSLLTDTLVERRFVGAHLLAQLRLNEGQQVLVSALEDADLRVAWCAFQSLQTDVRRKVARPGLFESLERLLARCPKSRAFEPLVWPWMSLHVDRQRVADELVDARGDRPIQAVLRYLPNMSPHGRAEVVRAIAVTHAVTQHDLGELGDALLGLCGDASSYVRQEALKALKGRHLGRDADGIKLEALLTRKASDLRQGILLLLLNQPDEAALNSAERLLAARDALQRSAGLELLSQVKQAGRLEGRCRSIAQGYVSRHTELSDADHALVDAILEQPKTGLTLDDALGLLNPAERSVPIPPQRRDVALVTEAARQCLLSLDALIHEHRETPVTYKDWQGHERQELLGNVLWGFPDPNPELPLEADRCRLPLAEVWEEWWRTRPDGHRDPDGHELVRADAYFAAQADLFGLDPEPDTEPKPLSDVLVRISPSLDEPLKQPHLTGAIVRWLLRLHAASIQPDFLLDAFESSLSWIPQEEITRQVRHDSYDDVDWRDRSDLMVWLSLCRYHIDLPSSGWSPRHHVRLWRLLRWIDQPYPAADRRRPTLEEVLRAWTAGEASEADVLDQLLGPRERAQFGGSDFGELRALSARKPPSHFSDYPGLRDLFDRCCQRIIEVEIARGDLPTEASPAAMALRSVWGVDRLVRLLGASLREPLVRGGHYHDLGRQAVLSHLLRVSFPAETDTPECFAQRVTEAGIPEQRLIELAVFAPQWARYVEHALGWPHFASAVWWIYAHTKDPQWSVEPEVREAWAAEVSEHTPLSAANLLQGAVDVAWFLRAHRALGDERWRRLDAAAKFASDGTGHNRARLFASAMRGQIDRAELLARIKAKRQQDGVRALGLLPLATGAQRDGDVLARYQAIQEFTRGSRKFGSQRQASEKLAASIGLENLARTAGYPDPIRLEWAMEAREIADLAAGPISATADGVTVTLSIDDLGEPVLTVARGDQALKAVPAKLRKHEPFVALQERKRVVERQASRMRQSLEQAMIRGDTFTGAELRELFRHPVLAPMLSQLVFMSAQPDNPFAGYPARRGQVLEAHDGTLIPLGKKAKLRIAHPHDLLKMKEWGAWQRECFVRERIQPFKQVFRELYVLTKAEQSDRTASRRYDGHQVNPRQALALLGGRGWVAHPEEGVRRTFHGAGITAVLDFMGYTFTPADVDGFTIETVHFTRAGEWRPMDLAEVPPRLFSEVMRDVDLVVSVAHRGGVDPEATASTVEMRAALVKETSRLLGFRNVRVKATHVLVDGKLGQYSVHLGSGTVHRMPGGVVCIVPVHAQHRGRLFLPFADDDPKTAEVISKVVLLAKDQEIQDPTILEQLVA